MGPTGMASAVPADRTKPSARAGSATRSGGGGLGGLATLGFPMRTFSSNDFVKQCADFGGGRVAWRVLRDALADVDRLLVGDAREQLGPQHGYPDAGEGLAHAPSERSAGLLVDHERGAEAGAQGLCLLQQVQRFGQSPRV